jgi:hypothetical protein
MGSAEELSRRSALVMLGAGGLNLITAPRQVLANNSHQLTDREIDLAMTGVGGFSVLTELGRVLDQFPPTTMEETEEGLKITQEHPIGIVELTLPEDYPEEKRGSHIFRLKREAFQERSVKAAIFGFANPPLVMSYRFTPYRSNNYAISYRTPIPLQEDPLFKSWPSKVLHDEEHGIDVIVHYPYGTIDPRSGVMICTLPSGFLDAKMVHVRSSLIIGGMGISALIVPGPINETTISLNLYTTSQPPDHWIGKTRLSFSEENVFAVHWEEGMFLRKELNGQPVPDYSPLRGMVT